MRARLGIGGMGEVFLADDTALRRRVALKFVAGNTGPDADRRLQHEAYAIASLDHPFICKVFETGEHDGLRFIAMEYVEGRTLKERLADGPMPAADVLRLAAELADALEFAHARGIVHRDLKPANVMLSADGHVKVMDFGIAKRIGPEAGDWTTQTAAATADGLVGTLAYMSPEQVRGEAVDARSDVFAFGVMLHELLTGVNPFHRNSVFATAEAIARDAPAPLEPIVKDIPAGLAQLVGRCLEKDRERRPSFQEIRAALAQPDAPLAPRPSPRRFRRRMALALGAAAVVVAAVLWWRPTWLPFSQPALAFAERDWVVIADVENLTGDPVFDRSLNAALEVAIAQSRYVNVLPRERVQAALQRMRQPRDAALGPELAAELAVREGARAVLACSIAQIGRTFSLTARLIDPRTKAAVVRESVDADGRDRVLDALNDLAARVRRRLGESIGQLSAQSTPLPAATTSSLDALKLYVDSMRLKAGEESTGDKMLHDAIALDPDFAMALSALGYRYYLTSSVANRTEGDRLFARALALSNRLTLRERLWIQASADDARGNREQAVAGYKAYLAQYPDDARAWFRVGWTQMATLGQLDAAIEAFNQSIRIDPNDTASMINLATCYGGLKQFDRAVDTYHRAFALSPGDLLGQYVNGEYGSALVQLGRVEEARQAFEKMAAAPDALRQARGRRSMAYLLMHLGKYSAAAGPLREAIQINEANGNLLSAFRDRFVLAKVLEARGRTAEVDRELAGVDRLIARLSLGPEWLVRVVALRARRGQIAQARRLVALMDRAAGNALTDSTISRNLSQDRAYVDRARAEVELASGHVPQAVALLTGASARFANRAAVLEATGRTLRAAGRLEEAAARYEELLALAPFGYEEQEDLPAAHVALGEIYERLGRMDDARARYSQLVEQWKDGDADLALLKQARARLAAMAK